MSRLLVIAGFAVILAAGAAVAQPAPAQTNPLANRPAATPPPPPGQPGMGPDMRGPGMRGPGMRGMGPGRGMRREPPTAEQVRQRNAELFAQLDANRDGRATFEEYRAFQERRRLERQRQMFQRFSGGQDSVTLEQLNARAAERLNQREQRRGGGRRDR